MIEGGVVSFLGGLIQAAVGSSGGFGAMPLKRMGCAAKATLSARARCARISSAVPSCMAAGVIKPMPLWRCSWLYQRKNCWQCARGSGNRLGESCAEKKNPDRKIRVIELYTTREPYKGKLHAASSFRHSSGSPRAYSADPRSDKQARASCSRSPDREYT